MVYEDLDILLDMLSHCERVAYAHQPFYNYYKHAGSTTLDYTNPRLFDIMTAYQDAIDHAAVKYQDAVTYCVAKRILINLATPGFADYRAEFIELIRQLRSAFEASPSIMNDPDIEKICDYASQLTLPRRFICEREDWVQPWYQYSRDFKTIIPVVKTRPAGLVQRTNRFKLDYWLLQALFERGGLLILGAVKLYRPFGRLRAGGDVLAFKGEHCLLVGAQPRSPLISELRQRLIVGSESLAELLTMVRAQPEQWSSGTNKVRLVNIKDWLQ
ncbi:glycosyl transferase [Lactiplantibacillus sp. DA1]|uniref:glycosyl transferase n=1 Tax=Lactiplantibacillus sp. DA1 TaxID=3079857 RepID=UPI00292A616D|nr:glycosyl transferase [Lactiplantibacillus sp. DA1]MDV0429863.1 glycosyl transferase [Lactiplantibacillus sp. DA1]